jgi:hypothetical protein
MKRRDWWLAACVVTLALGVGIGRAQEKITAPELLPAPKVCTQAVGLPPCAHEQGCCTDATGCKACTKAMQTAQIKCEGCEACSKQAKKTKKVKHVPVDRFVMPPPPAPPMMPVSSPMPITVFVPNPAASYGGGWGTPMAVPPMPAPPMPAANMMVFRASGHSTQSACSSDCEHGVEHAKYEIAGGSYAINVDFGFPIAPAAKKHEISTGKLEIDCGGPCKASCEKMTLHLGENQDVTIATMGKQVSLIGPSFKATCDNLTRCGADGCLCLMLQGHVHLHHDKGAMKSTMECDEIRILLEDGHMEISMMSAP